MVDKISTSKVPSGLWTVWPGLGNSGRLQSLRRSGVHMLKCGLVVGMLMWRIQRALVGAGRAGWFFRRPFTHEQRQKDHGKREDEMSRVRVNGCIDCLTLCSRHERHQLNHERSCEERDRRHVSKEDWRQNHASERRALRHSMKSGVTADAGREDN